MTYFHLLLLLKVCDFVTINESEFPVSFYYFNNFLEFTVSSIGSKPCH